MTDIEAIRALLAAATPGPWLRHTYGHKDGRSQLRAVAKALRTTREATGQRMTDLTWVEYADGTICLVGNGPKQTENGDFIANAPDAIAVLLAALDEARVKIRALTILYESEAAERDAWREQWERDTDKVSRERDHLLQANDGRAAAIDAFVRATAERDAARAEVERLNEHPRRVIAAHEAQKEGA